jgi:WD40 repeat protein
MQAARLKHTIEISGHLKYGAYSTTGVFLAMSDDGKIISSLSDSQIQIICSDTGKCISAIQDACVTSVDVSKDGTKLVACDRCTISQCDLSHIEHPIRLDKHYDPSYGYWDCVKLSPDGQKLLAGCKSQLVRIWDVQSGQMLLNVCQTTNAYSKTENMYQIEGLVSLAWSPDSTLVAGAGCRGGILVWDAVTGTPVMPPLQGHKDKVKCIVFSSTGKFLVSCGSDKEIILWDIKRRTGKERCTLSGHQGTVSCVSLSPDDEFIVSGSHDNTVRIWEVTTKQQVRVFENHAGACACACACIHTNVCVHVRACMHT